MSFVALLQLAAAIGAAPAPWHMDQRADPMTDVPLTAIMLAEEQQRATLALTCQGKKQQLAVHVIDMEGAKLRGRWGEAEILLRYDDQPPINDRWEFMSGDDLYVRKPGHLDKVLTSLTAARQLRVRVTSASGSPKDYSFKLTSVAEAVAHARATCSETAAR